MVRIEIAINNPFYIEALIFIASVFLSLFEICSHEIRHGNNKMTITKCHKTNVVPGLVGGHKMVQVNVGKVFVFLLEKHAVAR